MSLRADLALCVSLAAAACAHGKAERPVPPSVAEPARAAMRVLAREYLDAYFRWKPEDATTFAVPVADDATVQDPSQAALAAWQAAEDGFLARVRALDPRALAGSPEADAQRVLRNALEAAQDARACRLELWTVSVVNGWQREYAALAKNQPIGTLAHRAAAVARISALARRLDGEIANLREGARLGYVATREDVEGVVAELDRLLATPAAQWPQVGPGDRDDDPAFTATLVSAVDRHLAPAAARYRTFLRDEYIVRARRTPSLLALPDGDRCNRAAVRVRETLELEPSEFHASRVARAQALQPALLQAAAMTPKVWVNYGTSLHFAGRYEEAVRAYDHALTLGCDSTLPVGLVVRNIALALVRLRAYDDARTRLVSYLKDAPRDAATTVVLASVEVETGRLDEAEAAARKALAIDPRLSRGFQILGQVQDNRGDFQGAIDSWTTAARLDPADPLPVYSMGRIEEKRGNIAEACGSYDRARRAVAWSSAGKSALAAYDRLCRGRGPLPDAGAAGPTNRAGPEKPKLRLVETPDGRRLLVDDMTLEHLQSTAPQPTQASLQALLARVTRVRIIGAGMSNGNAMNGPVLLDTSAPEHLAALRRHLAIAEDPNRFGHCMCLGQQTFELYVGLSLRAAIGLHHGVAIRWGAWRDDAPLADPMGLLRWLASLGVDGPLKEFEKNTAAAAQQSAQREAWYRAMPASLRPFRIAIDHSAPGPARLDTRAMLDALRGEHPDPGARARALFAWYAAGSGLWSGFPAYEEVVDELLLACDTRELLAALEGRTLTDAEAEGAARYFAGWTFRKQKPQDAKLISPALRNRLLQAGSRTTSADRLNRARAAFGER